MSAIHKLQDLALKDREGGMDFEDIADKYEVDEQEARKLVIAAQSRRSRIRVSDIRISQLTASHKPYEVPETATEKATRLTGEMCDRAGRTFA